MTTQRQASLVCSLICLMVVGNYAIRGIFGILQMICAGWLVVFILAMFFEHVAMKALIVLNLFLIASVQLFQGDNGSYLGIVGFCLAYFYCYTFDFLKAKVVVKTGFIIAGFLILLGISMEGDLGRIIMRAAMTCTIVSLAWIALAKLISDARRLAEIQKDEMFKRFKKAVEAGLSIAEWEEGKCTDVTTEN